MTVIVAAQPGDLDSLGGVVARAFHDLPPARWLIGNGTIRRRIFLRYFHRNRGVEFWVCIDASWWEFALIPAVHYMLRHV